MERSAPAMLELRKMNYDDIVEQWKYITLLPANENGLTNPYEGVSFDIYRDSVLPELMMHENPVHMPDWFVPETYYYLWEDDRLLGEFRIRHYLTEALKLVNEGSAEKQMMDLYRLQLQSLTASGTKLQMQMKRFENNF